MAFDSAEDLPRRPVHGVRSMANLEAGVRGKPQRIPSSNRVRIHGAVRKIRDTHDLVWACVVIGVTTPTGLAALNIVLERGHW